MKPVVLVMITVAVLVKVAQEEVCDIGNDSSIVVVFVAIINKVCEVGNNSNVVVVAVVLGVGGIGVSKDCEVGNENNIDVVRCGACASNDQNESGGGGCGEGGVGGG